MSRQSNSNSRNNNNRGGRPKYHSKSRKSRNNRNDEGFKEDAKLESKGRDNDPNWYFTSSEIANQAAQLSFQEFIGTKSGVDGYKCPAITAIEVNPCPGITLAPENYLYDLDSYEPQELITQTTWNTGSPNLLPDNAYIYKMDGINLSAMKTYTLMSSFTGRTQQYGPQDIAMMILAISEVAAISEHLRRAFGVLLTYNERNRMLPIGLLKAMGFNPDDMITNLADYRMQFNVLMTKINQIPLLDNIGYIRKSRDIFQRVYQDDASPMATIFFYKPHSTWILDEETYSQGSILSTVSFTSESHSTMQNWLTTLRQMIDTLLNSSTLQLVYADLMNLSSKISLPQWKFDLLSETYVVMPEVNANALLQFHNLDVVGEPGFNSTYTLADHEGIDFTPNNDVYPDASLNCIVYNPLWDQGVVSIPKNTATGTLIKTNVNFRSIVDTITPNPSIEDRIEALRFSSILSPYQILARKDFSANNDYRLYAMMPALGDRYCVKLEVFRDIEEDPISINYNGFTVPSTGDTFIKQLERLNVTGLLSQMNCHPLVYRRGNDGSIANVFGDLSFFTAIEWTYLVRINRLIYQGLFEFRV